MPAKSRKKRAKNLPPVKKAKVGSPDSVNASAPAEESVPPVVEAARPAPVKAAARTVDATVNSYPFIKPELITIGIIAAAMIALLAILGAVL